jgi:tape measure domain-containing protein
MAKQETKIIISAVDKATAVFRKISAAANNMKIKTPSFGGAAGGIVAAIGGTAALGIIGKTSDEMANLDARFKDAFGSAEAGNAALAETYTRAQRVGTSYSSMAAAVARLAPAYSEIGRPATEAIDAVQTLSTMLKMNGASAMETSASMLQFAQALGSGKLAGDELKSLAENSPVFMRTLAKSLGTTSGMLKQMGSDGLLTSEVIANALKGVYTNFDQLAATLPRTFGTTFERGRNTFEKFVQTLQRTGAFQSLLNGADSLLQKFDQFVADPMKMEKLAQSIKSGIDAFVAIAPVVGTAGVAIVAYNAALGITSFASKAASLATLALNTSFAFTKAAALGAIAGLRGFAIAARLNVAVNGLLAGSMLTLRSAGNSLIGVFRGVAAAMLANPVGVVVGAIAAFVAVVAAAYSYSEPLRAAVGRLWDALGKLANAFGITGSFGDNFGAVMGWIGDKVSFFVNGIAKAVEWMGKLVAATGLFNSSSATVAVQNTQKITSSSSSGGAAAKGASVVAGGDKAAVAQFNASIQTNAQAASKNLATAAKEEQTASKDAATTQSFSSAVSTFTNAINALPAQIASALSNVSVNVNVAGGTAPSRSALPTGAMG